MVYFVAGILFIMWLLGLATANTMGGFIHIVLIVAVISVLVKVMTGRKAA
jgi:hypothetical protein